MSASPLLRIILVIAVTLPLLLLFGGFLIFGSLSLMTRLSRALWQKVHVGVRIMRRG